MSNRIRQISGFFFFSVSSFVFVSLFLLLLLSCFVLAVSFQLSTSTLVLRQKIPAKLSLKEK